MVRTQYVITALMGNDPKPFWVATFDEVSRDWLVKMLNDKGFHDIKVDTLLS